MKIKPLFNKVVLENIKNKSDSTSKILIPDNQDDKSEIAKVVAIGTGGKLDGNDIVWHVKKGDKVIYNKFSVHEFCIDDETFLIISQDDILAVIE